ncbi:hypothetical protein F5X68DRAFT_192610 [Plectosphaerella plurivora]|uniref:Uncharacterized protein n=1 Tax=Plectosphaerella plurivora TaxID=936078 RepID=A0A9P8V8G5_9PEZI|nr:hypothetical protein F5X68DRAFT_192610 [Plectosphaerella plurivora]
MTPPPETDPTPEPSPAPPAVIFRSSKKRKANLRQRATDDDIPSTDDTPTTTPVAPSPQTIDQLIASASVEPTSSTTPEPSITDALRLRAQHRRPRHKGVGFTSSTRDDQTPTSTERSLVLSTQPQDDPEPVGGMISRFAPQTGLSTQLVNKHITYRPPATASPQDTTPVLGSATLQGKLMEIDLGDEARARNIALTQHAARRLNDPSAAHIPDSDQSRSVKKPRLGRDGKPYRPRNRRGSEDIARDRLVEEILHESRLDVYEPLPDDEPAPAGEDTTADDRLAEEFQREFLDAMALRRQQHAAAVAQRKRNAIIAGGTGTRAGPEEDVLRGPKLGGSRSQRSAMRDILLAKEKEKIKTRR